MMNCLAVAAFLTLIGPGANITTLATTSTLPGHTTVTPQTSVIVQGGNTTVSPGGEGRKLKCYSCPEARYKQGPHSYGEEKCYTDFTRYLGDQRKTEEECPSTKYMCGRATYLISGKKYIYRGCINITRCSGQEYCKTDQNKKQCDVACCSWDFCNGAMNETPNRCYTCTNSHDYASCNTGATTCTSRDDLCVKVKTKNVYFKSCINKAGCNTLQEKCKNNNDCAAHCCYGDLFNSGMITSKNAALMVNLSLFLLAVTNFLLSP